MRIDWFEINALKLQAVSHNTTRLIIPASTLIMMFMGYDNFTADGSETFYIDLNSCTNALRICKKTCNQSCNS